MLFLVSNWRVNPDTQSHVSQVGWVTWAHAWAGWSGGDFGRCLGWDGVVGEYNLGSRLGGGGGGDKEVWLESQPISELPVPRLSLLIVLLWTR